MLDKKTATYNSQIESYSVSPKGISFSSLTLSTGNKNNSKKPKSSNLMSLSVKP